MNERKVGVNPHIDPHLDVDVNVDVDVEEDHTNSNQALNTNPNKGDINDPCNDQGRETDGTAWVDISVTETFIGPNQAPCPIHSFEISVDWDGIEMGWQSIGITMTVGGTGETMVIGVGSICGWMTLRKVGISLIRRRMISLLFRVRSFDDRTLGKRS